MRSLKPSQRGQACGAVAEKPLRARWHARPCGASCRRDVQSALVLLAWGIVEVLCVFLASRIAALWEAGTGSGALSPESPARSLRE